MIEYRPAEARDAEAVAALHARSWREHYRGSFSDAFLDGDLVAERLSVWRERLARPADDQLVQLAVDGEALLGFVCAYADHDPEWGSFIDNLHVASDAKRGGIGTSLMKHAGAWLDGRRPDLGVHLLVLEVNAAARRFYERIGGRNAGVSTLETHGGARVRSCRYSWPSARLLASGGRGITVRRMEPSALHRIAEIDRSEHVTEEVVQRAGVLARRRVDVSVPRWSRTGDPEHSLPGRIAAWQPILARGGTLLGAFDGERLAGFAIYRPRLTAELGNLAALYVSRPYRRLGVASELGDEVARLARGDGARRLYVSATPSGSTLDFYQARGFVPTEQPHPELFALEPDDIHMILEL